MFNNVLQIESQSILNEKRGYLFSAVNGGAPVNMSYMRAPSDHQSTALPCPLRVKISGAMYSIVPQKLKESIRYIVSSILYVYRYL